MKRIFFISCILQFIFLFSFAQEKETVYRFHSINSLALINGNNAVSAGLQSVNGFQKKNWFGGIGVAIDYYLYRTVPVFADVRYSFGKKKNKFFAFADAGINISWVENNNFNGPIFIWEGSNTSNYKNGVYSDLGFGYNIKMGKNNALVLALSQSHKSLKETFTYTDWRTNQPQTNVNQYRLNRINLKIGWQF